MDNYAIIVGYFLLLAIAPSSLGKIISAIPQDVHWRVDYSLLTFAAYCKTNKKIDENCILFCFSRV